MNIENTQSQMRKGILEFCILSVIRRGEAYPSDIVEEMKQANLNILEGTLYPLLTRLKNADMLTYRWVESNSGPPRKYFSLTPKGIIESLNLRRPIYRKTAAYGHFGRSDKDFTWEATDKAQALKEAAGVKEPAAATK